MKLIKFQKNGITREVKVGYSWTVAFFGPIPLVMRGHWSWAALTTIVCMLTWGMGGFGVGFWANRATARWLCENGWVVVNKDELPPSWGIAA